jgi:protein-tyrosine phosphatase
LSKNVCIVTDFHSHLLPDVDCAGKPETSAKLLKQIEALGVQNIVLTPHFYPDTYSSVDSFLAHREKRVNRLLAAMENEGVENINITVGAEVLLCPGLEKMEGLEKLCIGNTKNILIEMPDLPWSDVLLDSLRKIKKKLGLEVIIAHADRYGKELAESLISLGYKIQVNADSTISFSMKKVVCKWASEGYVYALGSDKHVHSNKTALVYNEFPKAAKILSKYADIINERSLKLIGK